MQREGNAPAVPALPDDEEAAQPEVCVCDPERGRDGGRVEGRET
jgi:hypothetical protein